MSRARTIICVVTVFSWSHPTWAVDPPSKSEPLAREHSIDKASAYLESAANAWMNKQHCIACHTGYPYVLAGPSFGPKPAPILASTRKYLEDRVAHWDRGREGDSPDPGDEGVTEVVATAATLAFHDAQTTGQLHPLTRKALDRMWTIQQADGVWDWNKHRLPPLEYDEYFGAVYAALGLGHAPEGYAKSDSAKTGLAKLLTYFRKNPPPNMHHRTWLLWASLKLDGLMTADERKQSIRDLLGLQRPDGGWCLPSLGNWKRLDGSANNATADSDGYATGLAVYVLRQAGVPANDEAIQKAVRWLTSNQRESGRWFTRSVNADRDHYITNAGTALAVMALRACEPIRAVLPELKKLEGTWQIISDINDGKEMPADMAKKIRLIFAGDGDWKVTVDGNVVGAGTTKLDPTKNPKTVDYTFTEGEEKGKSMPGIYELNGDTFRHCGVMKGARPTEFSSKPGSGQWLVTFRREKK
jgi:squalene-hopene/tetraprenyl-beta-curcumene cyclase